MPSREFIVDTNLWKIILGVALLGFSLFIYRRTYPQLAAPRRVLLGTLRAFLFLSLVIFLLDPAIVERGVELVDPALVALVDCSRSMSIDDCGGMSRIDCALAGLDELRSIVEERGDVELVVTPFSGAPGDDEGGHRFDADGEGTDIIGAIRAAEIMYRDRNPAGILLFTDGRITHGMLAPGIETRLPVYAVGVGDTVGPPDAAIDDVIYDPLLYTGSEQVIEAVVAVSGYEGRSLTVRLLEGGEELDRKRIDIGTGRGKAAVGLSYVPVSQGPKRLTVEVQPAPGEEWTGNNSEMIGLRVLKERIRLLYIDRFADWNATFLRDLVRRTERFEMTGITWRRDRGYVEFPGYRSIQIPSSARSFARYDLLIISDGEELLSDPSVASAIAGYVEGGGALLLLADEHSPLTSGFDQLGGVMPVVRSGPARIEAGEYGVALAPAGIGHPLAHTMGELERLPPLTGRISGYGLSSAAEVPFEMTDRLGSYPFLAMQRFGDGITAVLLGLPLWRWKLAGSDAGNAYDAFLAGLIQYLIEGEQLTEVRVESARSAYRLGERIVLDLDVPPGAGAGEVKGELYGGPEGDEIVATYLFGPEEEGRRRAEIDPLPPGTYRAVVRMSGDERATETSASFSVLPVSIEFMDLSRDMDLLRHLARVSGGRAVERGEIGDLAESLDLEPVERERKSVIELGNTPLLLIAALLLLTAEWVLRKIWGLI